VNVSLPRQDAQLHFSSSRTSPSAKRPSGRANPGSLPAPGYLYSAPFAIQVCIAGPGGARGPWDSPKKRLGEVLRVLPGYQFQVLGKDRYQRPGQDSHPALPTLGVSHDDLTPLKIQVLDAQAHAFSEPQAGAIHDGGCEPYRTLEPTEQDRDLPRREHHGQLGGRLARTRFSSHAVFVRALRHTGTEGLRAPDSAWKRSRFARSPGETESSTLRARRARAGACRPKRQRTDGSSPGTPSRCGGSGAEYGRCFGCAQAGWVVRHQSGHRQVQSSPTVPLPDPCHGTCSSVAVTPPAISPGCAPPRVTWQ
jgi:hypothetical protein